MKVNPGGGGMQTSDRLKALVLRGHPCATQNAGCFPGSCGEAAAAVAHIAFLGV